MNRDLLSTLATKYTNKAKDCPDRMGPMVSVDIGWLHGCFQDMGLELIAELQRAIPASFYGDRDLLFRLRQLVSQWRTLIEAAQQDGEK